MLCGYKINLQKSRVFSILIITKYNFFLNFKLRKVNMRRSQNASPKNLQYVVVG